MNTIKKNVLTVLYKGFIGAGVILLVLVIPLKIMYNIHINDDLFFKVYASISLFCFTVYLLEALYKINKK